MSKSVNKQLGLKSAAVLTIHGPGKMTKRGRRDIAKWLRKCADDLEQYGDAYTNGRYTARYLYDAKET